jgi:hypothetical protein
VKEEKYQVSAIMQSISQLYSRYYSSKYNSYGPLYRRRYYSEPINDPERLEVVMRYVHQEPMRVIVPQKAGFSMVPQIATPHFDLQSKKAQNTQIL